MRNNNLLMVIPSVVRRINGTYEVEEDFSNDLTYYLKSFDQVTFACTVFDRPTTIVMRSVPLADIADSHRLRFIALPFAYREDRYWRHYLTVKKLLRSEIAKAEYLLFSPFTNYDWSTPAALQAIKLRRDYVQDTDVDFPALDRFRLADMPPGLKKLRKAWWARSFAKRFNKCLAHSSVALLQGQDVFDAYQHIAPNPHKTANVQLTDQDYISTAQLTVKLQRIRDGQPLIVAYAGQVQARKGALDWIKVINHVLACGSNLQATWFGDGEQMPQMRTLADNRVTLAGIVGHEQLMAHLRNTDMFVFCHKTSESPRCLSQALAAGCALIGYGTSFSRSLVATHGGGEFTPMEWQALAALIMALDADRPRLAQLVEAAAASGQGIDRGAAMRTRIELIRGTRKENDETRDSEDDVTSKRLFSRSLGSLYRF
jgi:glycosyltransferase involved in cell wall biosynthesis